MLARPMAWVPCPGEMATGKTALDDPLTPGHLAGEADYPALGSAECAVSEDESVDWVRVVPLSMGCAVTAGLEAVRTSSFCIIFESTDSTVDMRVSIVEAVVRSSVSATEVEAGGERRGACQGGGSGGGNQQN